MEDVWLTNPFNVIGYEMKFTRKNFRWIIGAGKVQSITILLSHRAQSISWPNYHQAKQSCEKKNLCSKMKFESKITLHAMLRIALSKWVKNKNFFVFYSFRFMPAQLTRFGIDRNSAILIIAWRVIFLSNFILLQRFFFSHHCFAWG